MKHFAVILLMLFGCAALAQDQVVRKPVLDYFALSAGIGYNHNKHHKVEGYSEELKLNWISVFSSISFQNRFVQLGFQYEQPIVSSTPPKRYFHLYQFKASINFLAVGKGEFYRQWYFGPALSFGKTTGYQDVDVRGGIDFDDKIISYGGVANYEYRSGIRFFLEGYTHSFIDDNIVTPTQRSDEYHRNVNVTVGVMLYPFLLAKSKG